MLDLPESKDCRYLSEDEEDAQRKTLCTNGQMLSISLTVMSFTTKTLTEFATLGPAFATLGPEFATVGPEFAT